MSAAVPTVPPFEDDSWRPSRDFFGGPPPVDPANIPDPISEHEFLHGEVPPEFVFTAGGAIAAPSQARRYAAFKPLLDKLGPGAGAMVEREMDRARAFEVIARAATEFIDAMTGDDWDEAHDALAEAVAENRAAIA